MGLFSNNKKLCPICGNPTPRLFPKKLGDTPICSECESKIDLPDGAWFEMTLEGLETYMEVHKENQALRDAFSENYRYVFGFAGGMIIIDNNNRLFRLQDNNNKWTMDASNLKSFRILEDDKVVYESCDNKLLCHTSDVPEKAEALQPIIDQYLYEKREYEMMERVVEMREEMNKRRPGEFPASSASDNLSRLRPSLDVENPLDKFYVELTLEHPYWSEARRELSAPSFSTISPSVSEYLQDYQGKADEMHELAVHLMDIICPGAEEIYDAVEVDDTVAAPAQAVPVVDAVEEIKKYKELLDSGIITEEEFAAKKRQLMGI